MNEKPIEALISNERVSEEYVLAAYSLSEMIPKVIEYCQPIDPEITQEIEGLFQRYLLLSKHHIEAGAVLSREGTEVLSAEKIQTTIQEKIQEIEHFFGRPENQNVEACLGYRQMLEFNLLFLED